MGYRDGRPRLYEPDAICRIRGCEEPRFARDWCRKHYMRFYKQFQQRWEKENRERRFKRYRSWILKRKKQKIRERFKSKGKLSNEARLRKIHKAILEEDK